MSPEQLGELTYGQFLDMYEGWKYARKLRMQELAQQAAWIMSVHTKRPVDPRKLLQEEDKKKKKTTKEKTQRVLGGLMAEFGGDIQWLQ